VVKLAHAGPREAAVNLPETVRPALGSTARSTVYGQKESVPARQVSNLTDKEVYIVLTDTMPQGIAALLACNFEADFATNCQTMTEAAKNTQTAEITTAVRTVHIDGVRVREGDFIGLINGNLTVAGQNIEDVIRDTLQRMHIDRYEILTLYYGQDVTAQEAQETAKRIKAQYSRIEIEVVDGGQPYYAYILSAE
ncbi:MAG TPA: hypothetical protein VIY29_19085, partial [Ktedonobacteraceae bacterium]